MSVTVLATVHLALEVTLKILTVSEKIIDRMTPEQAERFLQRNDDRMEMAHGLVMGLVKLLSFRHEAETAEAAPAASVPRRRP